PATGCFWAMRRRRWSGWSAATSTGARCRRTAGRQNRSRSMAGSLNSGAENDDLAENHEINVTPFIDVMLVLLIIFMVAAPLATVDINVDLPQSAASQQPRPDKPLYV